MNLYIPEGARGPSAFPSSSLMVLYQSSLSFCPADPLLPWLHSSKLDFHITSPGNLPDSPESTCRGSSSIGSWHQSRLPGFVAWLHPSLGFWEFPSSSAFELVRGAFSFALPPPLVNQHWDGLIKCSHAAAGFFFFFFFRRPCPC